MVFVICDHVVVRGVGALENQLGVTLLEQLNIIGLFVYAIVVVVGLEGVGVLEWTVNWKLVSLHSCTQGFICFY